MTITESQVPSAQYTEEQLLAALAYTTKYRKIETLFPDKGPTRRSLYKKHLLHFAKGKDYKQRLLMCANRVGKTLGAGCELVWHLTGEYPKWWKGHRFTVANDWVIAGNSSKTVLKIFQPILLGPVGEFGTGLIPKSSLDFGYMTQAKKGDTLITDFRVKHVSGGWSRVTVKTYEEGRKSFEGTTNNVWLDEEPPEDIYQECLMRTMTGGCILMMTFTPLTGLTDTILNFIGSDGDYTEGKKGESKWLTTATWDDVPHLDEKEKAALMESIPKHLRDAKTKGIPILGSGAVYSIAEERVFIDPIMIPEHFRRVYSIDFGWYDPTAVLWGAIDPETDILYIYAEHYLKENPPSVHAAIIQQRNKLAGFSIPSVSDPSGGGTSAKDGTNARLTYSTEHGLNFWPAINSLEPGIALVFDLMVQGKIKVFNTCTNFKTEYRLYRRDENGKLRGPDHLMDDLRYMVASGLSLAKSFTQWKTEQVAAQRDYSDEIDSFHTLPDAWLYR